MSVNANEEMLTGNTDASYPDTDPGATYFKYRLCLHRC